MDHSRSSIGGAAKSDCQAGPVSQNQIRQREHDVEFCLLFSEASVSGLFELQQTLHDTEHMFHFCLDRGFCVFPFLGLILTAFAELAKMSRLRNRPSVSPLGTWLLESTPQKSEKARLSMTSATVPSSERS